MKKPPPEVVLTTAHVTHVCPFKKTNVALYSCYINSADYEHDYCYGCDHVPALKEQFGLRTFLRKLVRARCENCSESPALHAKEPPYAGLRDTRCKGFKAPPAMDLDIFVATNEECTEWMVVKPSGERLTLAQWKEQRYVTSDIPRALGQSVFDQRRYRLPLLGQPSGDHVKAAMDAAHQRREKDRERYNAALVKDMAKEATKKSKKKEK